MFFNKNHIITRIEATKMLEINKPTDVTKLSKFLESLNLQPTHHIGYCGQDAKEIEHTILHEFSDLDLEHSFAVASQKETIKGALGFDIDEEKRTVEVWGPFVIDSEEYKEIADALWSTLVSQMPFEINTYEFFVDKKNFRTREYIRETGGVETGQHFILSAKKENFSTQSKEIIEYNPSYKASFEALHNTYFPDTYYNSTDILSRLDHQNRLFIVADDTENVKGYVYVEAEPSLGDGTIEYIAVSSDHRKQGIGTQLIHAALQYLFSYDTFTEITLSVSSGNDQALSLYKSCNFEIMCELKAYRK